MTLDICGSLRRLSAAWAAVVQLSRKNVSLITIVSRLSLTVAKLTSRFYTVYCRALECMGPNHNVYVALKAQQKVGSNPAQCRNISTFR